VLVIRTIDVGRLEQQVDIGDERVLFVQVQDHVKYRDSLH
jgi:hypothetical protein